MERREEKERNREGRGREHQSIGYTADRWTIAIVREWVWTDPSKRGINKHVEIKERRRKVINTYYELISRSIRNEAKHIHVMPLSRLEL